MKTHQEIREFMKSGGYVEIDREEWYKLNDDGEVEICCAESTLYFKPKEQDVFESETRKFTLNEEGILTVSKHNGKKTTHFHKDSSLPTLIKAVEEWKRRYDDE